MAKASMNANGIAADNTFYTGWLKQLGVAVAYVLLLYMVDVFFACDMFPGNIAAFNYFEAASGFALAVLLIGGKRYAWGVFLGAILLDVILYGSLWKAVIIASGNTLQALCGAWLLTKSGFDLRLQSLRGYLQLILLGGCIGIVFGALVVSTMLLLSGWLPPGEYFHSLRYQWMSDTLGVVLVAPLVLTWWRITDDWRKTGRLMEAFLLLGMTILLGQIVFLDWLHNGVVHAPKGYWMFLPITWVAIRLGARGTSLALLIVATQALFGAIHGTGYFANDIAQTHLVNFWIYMLTLSVVSMALAAHIAERSRMENDLQAREASLRAILDNLPYLAWLKDTQCRYITANVAYANYARRKNYSEIIGKTDLDLWPRELAQKYCADDAEVMATRRQKHVEEPSLDGDRMHWVETFKTPIIDESGNVLGTAGLAMDITERKLVEEALLQSESRHRLLVENSPMCIHEMDMDGRIASMNRAGLLMIGAEDESAVRGFLYLDAVSAADRERIGELLAKAYAGETSHFEFKSSGPRGQIFKSCFVPIRNREGSVEKLMGITEDITARKQAEEEIHHLAFYDTLTKLPNRRLFLDRFGAALIASARHNNFGAVLFIDLDRFKLLNDTLGHDYGDLLLIEVAARIRACVREMDTVARLGGDEFVVLIEGIGNDQVEASHKVGLVAEKIRQSLARPYHLNGHEHHSSPSIGVSLYRGNEETVDELLHHADMAMYQAKESGRNAVRFFDPVMQNNVATRAALVSDLRNAISNQQLHLHYQLQVDNNSRPVGAEALLRWMHPQRGTVMPEQFLPVAEESTLILDICNWVLEAACRQLASWGNNGKMRDLVLTVNISAKQFAMPDFADKVAGALQTHRINPARLKLELTESMALDDLPGAVEKMHALKALGVCLSMDDFGTRYSSLSNLKQLPLDQVKLGRSFVRDVASDGNVALLVQSIIDLSSKYRITVIAEGVENEAQLASLKDRDCVAYQGFLFSKAISIEEFEQLLNRS